MALLTSDIVWLVNQTVTLPDGSQQIVLVPQVYAKLKEGDLTGDSALLGGSSVALSAQQDITNSGSIHGREMTQLSAQSLTNSGYIEGNRISLTARQDITNTGGTISGSEQVSLLAGRNITSQSTVRASGSDRWTDRAAGIYVQGADGGLTLSALNTITLTGSTVANAGRNLSITAGGADITVQGSQLQAGQDVLLSAKRDVNLLSAEESSSTRSQNSSQGSSAGVGTMAGSGVTRSVSMQEKVNEGCESKHQ